MDARRHSWCVDGNSFYTYFLNMFRLKSNDSYLERLVVVIDENEDNSPIRPSSKSTAHFVYAQSPS